MRNILLIGLLGLGGWYYLRRLNLSKRIKIVFRGVSLSGGDLLRPRVNLSLGVQNPTNVTTSINSIVGTVSVNGKPLADVSDFKKYTIGPNSETKINVQVEVKTGAIIGQLLRLIGGKEKGVTVNFTGTVNAENVSIPVNTNYKF